MNKSNLRTADLHDGVGLINCDRTLYGYMAKRILLSVDQVGVHQREMVEVDKKLCVSGRSSNDECE